MNAKRTNGHMSAEDEVNIMPTIELVECERTAYIKGMENYLQNLRQMSNSEAVRKSQKNLEDCHIICEDGEFSERYSNSRIYDSRKG